MSEEELTPEEKERRAKFDLLLLDIHLRTMQVIQMRRLDRFEIWKAIAGLAVAVVTVAAGILGLAHFLR